MLEREFGKGKWLERFLNYGEGLAELADRINREPGCTGGVAEKAGDSSEDGLSLRGRGEGTRVKQILDHLARGMSVVLEFGKYENNLAAYILVANLLTRRIHDQYVRKAEGGAGGGGRGAGAADDHD